MVESMVLKGRNYYMNQAILPFFIEGIYAALIGTAIGFGTGSVFVGIGFFLLGGYIIDTNRRITELAQLQKGR